MWVKRMMENQNFNKVIVEILKSGLVFEPEPILDEVPMNSYFLLIGDDDDELFLCIKTEENDYSCDKIEITISR